MELLPRNQSCSARNSPKKAASLLHVPCVKNSNAGRGGGKHHSHHFKAGSTVCGTGLPSPSVIPLVCCVLSLVAFLRFALAERVVLALMIPWAASDKFRNCLLITRV